AQGDDQREATEEARTPRATPTRSSDQSHEFGPSEVLKRVLAGPAWPAPEHELTGRPYLAGVDREILGGRVIGLDIDVVARSLGDETDGLLPDRDLLGAGRYVLDLEIPLVIGHRVVGIVEDHPVRLHPGMDTATHPAGGPLGRGGGHLDMTVRFERRI